MIKEYFKKIYGSEPAVVAQAPGRLEFIGNHVDYNKGIVMGVSIDNRISVAVSLRDDNEIHMASQGLNAVGKVTLDTVALQKDKQAFMNYPLGVFAMLRAAGMKADKGFCFADTSTVPTGAGVSSSAAIELATAYALSKLYNFPMEKIDLVRLARKAENDFVGMPCGILDQGVSGFGAENALVRIDCKTETFSTLPLPEGTAFWVFNSQTKHSLVDGMYAKRFDECMRAASVLARYNKEITCLADASVSAVEANRSKMDDGTFRRALHVSGENARVLEMENALAAKDLFAVGDLLKASHFSSRYFFENTCPEIDFLVDEVSKQDNVYGARISGGGWGGVIIVLTNSNYNEEEADVVVQAFEKKFGHKASYFKTTTGPGAGLVE